MRLRSWTRAALRLYPKPWRQRYGDEFLAMLEAREVRACDVFDMLGGALREQFWPSVGDSMVSLLMRVGAAAALTSVLFRWTLLDVTADWVGDPVDLVPFERAYWLQHPNAYYFSFMRDLWGVPFLGLVASFVAFRRLGIHRWLLAVTAIVSSVAIGLSWLLGVVWIGRMTAYAYTAIPFYAAMFAFQAILAFLILDRRSRAAEVNP